MRIALITPYGAETLSGNWHTAARWAKFLREAGYLVEVMTQWDGKQVDLMIALHARRSAPSIHAFAARHPAAPLIVVLTGTDLYRDIQNDASAKASLILAHRLVVLQENGIEELAPALVHKTRIIYQSSPDIPVQPQRRDKFEVLVLAHLREEKDPFRPALAAAYLPEQSTIRVTHVGRALSAAMKETARAVESQVPRWHWIGELTHDQAMNRLAQSDLLVVSSLMEGGANVICEALAAGVPIIASDIAGNIGMLGEDYPGYYPVGDERRLAQVLSRAENDPDFYAALIRHCRERRARMTPGREATSVRQLVAEFEVSSTA